MNQLPRTDGSAEQIDKRLLDERLAFLKIELPILSAKIDGIVDVLWKIRAACVAIWTAVTGAGLTTTTLTQGAASGGTQVIQHPHAFLLPFAAVVPILFWIIDCKNNQWYRRISRREYEIQQYINDVKDRTWPASFREELSRGQIEFPCYDLAGIATYETNREHRRFKWQASFIRSAVDPIPFGFYGLQIMISGAIAAIVFHEATPWMRFSSLAIGGLLLIALLIVAAIVRPQKAGKPSTPAAANATSPRKTDPS
jgi:hypothetical protein